MEHYVGLDVSLKLTSICVVNRTGSIVQEGVVDSDPEAIASFVRLKAPGTVRLASRPDRRLRGYGRSSTDLDCR
jgi:transposase